jgi:hypothetical protein
MAVIVKSTIFWVAACLLFLLGLVTDSEEGGDIVLQSVKFFLNCMVLHTRRSLLQTVTTFYGQSWFVIP